MPKRQMQFALYTKKIISDLDDIAYSTQKYPQYAYIVDDLMKVQRQLQQNEISLQQNNKPKNITDIETNLIKPTIFEEKNPFLKGGNLMIHDPLSEFDDDI